MLILGVLVRGVAFVLAGVGLLAVGCGGPAVTNTAVVAPVSASALPLSAPEHAFLTAMEEARLADDADAYTLVGHGHTACTAVGSGGSEAALAAVRAASGFDEAGAREVVAAATETLCPAGSASASATPTATTSAGVAAGAGAGVPRRVVAVPRTTPRATTAPATTAVRTTTAPTTTSAPSTTSTRTPGPTTSEKPSGSYRNCAAAEAAGAAPLHAGEPGYSGKLDDDGDGVACER